MRFDNLAAITGGTVYNTDNAARTFAGVGIDSRSITAGQLFVAIRGEHNDGHDFITAAVDAGATGIVAEQTWPGLQNVRGDVAVVAVNNSHQAMLTLAADYRDKLDARIIGITGSNGKTTTKELTYHLLAAVTPDVYRSPGNLNNLYGVPLALFAIDPNTKHAVLELGISTTTEMPKLAEIVRPDVVAITNVGPSHLQFLDTVESIACAKLDLVRDADPGVPLVINADDTILMKQAMLVRDNPITFALDSEADFSVDQVEPNGVDSTNVTIEGYKFRLPLAGRHQVANLLGAYAIVRTLGFDFEDVDTENIQLSTAPMRGQTVEHAGITFVSDCYNANPASVRAGLEAFFALPAASRRIVVLGDMLELGREAEKYHREVGELLAQHEFDLAALVGPLSKHTFDSLVGTGIELSRLRHHPDAASCAVELGAYFMANDFVYVKASRGVGLEAVIHAVAHQGEDG
ncbi:MAG: UDP-N-acetylmuramoyl-tripeptide--D-alanyl-D-alanine ligase [candidate division Zixibacteria bacterium]|nr:UDP-N-acetylmuramoyl-tripeptide--D-alanyl-D-alanine ligase [candidate division Zixibacteria bacterium]MDH3938994.1 UDP-N-acetylmuramoyl-tripeptide--D-alanyl-D-alanine ligase [candidate division Zixibacteria bacterium]